LNPAWKRTLGWTLEELQARPFLDFVHPDDRQATLAEVGVLAGGAPTIAFENRYRRKDGPYRWLQWNASSLPDRRLIYATARDVTDQKRLEREILAISLIGKKSAWGGNCMTDCAKIWPASPPSVPRFPESWRQAPNPRRLRPPRSPDC
jgi:PAS domain S-box-containing protein